MIQFKYKYFSNSKPFKFTTIQECLGDEGVIYCKKKVQTVDNWLFLHCLSADTPQQQVSYSSRKGANHETITFYKTV